MSDLRNDMLTPSVEAKSESNVISGQINIDGGQYSITIDGSGAGQSWSNTGLGSGVISNGNIGIGSVVATTSGIIMPTSPMKLERERYTINDRLSFSDGEVVEVDISYFGVMKEIGKQFIVEGVVVGKQAMEGYDNWIIDLGDSIKCESYPYGVMVIPTAAICKLEKMGWE